MEPELPDSNPPSDFLAGLSKKQRDALKQRLARRRPARLPASSPPSPPSPAAQSIVDWMNELIREDQSRQDQSTSQP